MKLPRYPVFWLTIVVFAIVSLATRDLLLGGFFFALVLPAVLALQWVLRWLLRRPRISVRLRRTVMLLPALLLAGALFRSTNDFGGRQMAAVRLAMGGHTPKGIRELRIWEDAWTDYGLQVYFKCDPASLRTILLRPPFRQPVGQEPETISFAQSRSSELRGMSDVTNALHFIRTDLDAQKTSCDVYTDASFSFVYLFYRAD